MTQTHTADPAQPTRITSRLIEVFEPALCCNTGVCGTDPSQALISFTADCSYLASRGVRVLRHNLANDPQAFVDNGTVRAFLDVVGSAGLPLVLVDGVTVATGSYPDRAYLEQLALPHPDEPVHNDLGLTAAGPAESCCEGGSCC